MTALTADNYDPPEMCPRCGCCTSFTEGVDCEACSGDGFLDEYDEDPGRRQTEVDDVDGLTTIEEFGELTGYELPDGPYDTVAGYAMAQLGALPRLGDEVSVVLAPEGDAEGQPVRFTLTVTQMDGRRAAWFGLARAALPEAVPDA